MQQQQQPPPPPPPETPPPPPPPPATTSTAATATAAASTAANAVSSATPGAAPPPEDASDFLSITPLGSGHEVGRSCHILKYKGKTVMVSFHSLSPAVSYHLTAPAVQLDCGIHPAGKGIDALPYFDQIEADQIDILLISHFHLDHAASLPYFLEQVVADTSVRKSPWLTSCRPTSRDACS